MRQIKPDFTTFKRWSSETTCGLLDDTIRPWYQNTQNNLFTQVGDDGLLSDLQRHLSTAAAAYELKHGASLLGVGRTPNLPILWNRKSVESFLNKLYRINVIDNPSYPEPPGRDWIKPESSLTFGCVDDVVRSTVVVSYADGPAFLAGHIQKEAHARGYECVVKDHSKEKGYYAHHVYIGIRVDIASRSGPGFSEITVPVEMQITTELQAALREVTHKLYEVERLSGGLAEGWKEDFGSGRFRAAYMAHSLRFIEGMVVDLRTSIQKDHRE